MNYLRRKSYWDLQIRQTYRPHRNVHTKADLVADMNELLFQWWLWAYLQGLVAQATRHAPLA